MRYVRLVAVLQKVVRCRFNVSCKDVITKDTGYFLAVLAGYSIPEDSDIDKFNDLEKDGRRMLRKYWGMTVLVPIFHLLQILEGSHELNHVAKQLDRNKSNNGKIGQREKCTKQRVQCAPHLLKLIRTYG